MWCVSPSLRRQTLYPQQSMATVVLGRIHALMMASNVWWSDRRQVKDKCPQLPLDINKDPCCHAQTDPIILWSAEAAIYTCLPHFPPTTIRKAVKNNSKWSMTLPCGRTVTSQRQFGGQHGVLHDTGGSKKGILIWTRAQTITESQLKQQQTSSLNGWFCWQQDQFFVTEPTG